MKQNVYSVSQVNSYIKNMFAQDFLMNKIYIKGEVSNCTYHSTGHIYFTLKDKNGVLKGVMFAGNRRNLQFQLKEGDQVVVTGSIESYKFSSQYQIIARSIELDGTGNLYQKLEELKAELFNLRFQHATNQLDNPRVITEVKRTIARVKTILRERELNQND